MLQEPAEQHKPRPKEPRPEDRQTAQDGQTEKGSGPTQQAEPKGRREEKRGVSEDEGKSPATATRSEDQNPSVP